MNLRIRTVRLLVLPVLVTIMTLLSDALSPHGTIAATYYLSSTGSDANAGTSSTSPWKTFAFAIPKLEAGDTLILRDGTYNASNSGFPVINCSTTAHNGTVSQPITIKAENERQALLSGDGVVYPFTMRQCSYWTIDGLRAKSADNSGGNAADTMSIWNSSNITIKRILLTHNNRYTNSHLLDLEYSNNILVEESEFYYFHRHAICAWYVDNSVFRRNYLNSRLYPDLPDGRVSHFADRGDAGISIYPGSYNIIENNISENNEYLAELQAIGTTIQNRLLGNISLKDHYGLLIRARGTTANEMPQDTLIENFVAINPDYVGLFLRATKRDHCNNCTFIGGASIGGLVAYPEAGEWGGDGTNSTYALNTLAVNSSGVGFYMVSQSDWSIGYSNAFANSTNYSPNDSHVNNSLSQNPSLGNCLVWIPDSSPIKRAGKDGADIGANVLYRYQNGILTNTLLWDSSTGQFPNGAIITGVNDVSGSSCFDVHTRLNVNTNGCPFPSDYGQPSGPLSPPTGLRIVSTGMQ